MNADIWPDTWLDTNTDLRRDSVPARSALDCAATPRFGLRRLDAALPTDCAQHSRAQQWDVTWRNYVHEFFAEHPTDSEVRRRRRNLLLDLSAEATPVPLSELRVISGCVAEAYAKKTPRTLQRDIDALEEENLIVKVGKGYVANRSLTLAFLPASITGCRRNQPVDGEQDRM